MPDNIERSAFKKGEYVGYANGVWRIRKRADGGWTALKRDSVESEHARTLKELSAKLKIHEGVEVAHDIATGN